MQEFSKNLVEFYERLSSWELSVVRDSGLTLPQMHTLEILGNSGPLRMKDLARKLGVTTGTVTVMVDRLERMQLLDRVRSQSDKRSFSIELTDRGQSVYQEHHSHHLLLAEQIQAVLSRAQQQQFDKLLKVVLDNF